MTQKYIDNITTISAQYGVKLTGTGLPKARGDHHEIVLPNERKTGMFVTLNEGRVYIRDNTKKLYFSAPPGRIGDFYKQYYYLEDNAK